MNKMKPIVLLFIVLGCSLVNSLKLSQLPRKALAGPPSEFEYHKIPEPISGALTVDSSFTQFKLSSNLKHQNAKNGLKLSWDYNLNVDSAEEFILSVFTPIKDQLTFQLTAANGNNINLKEYAIEGDFPIGLHFVPETSYRFTTPVRGVWKFHVETTQLVSGSALAKLNADKFHGAILAYNKGTVSAFTHLNTYSLTTGQQIGLVTEITKDRIIQEGIRPDALRDVIEEADLDIVLPDGKEYDVKMHDDGLHHDLEANDGIYGASIQATETGIYRAQAVVKGMHQDGTEFVRTTQHLIPVVVDTMDLTSTTYTEMKSSNVMSIFIQVKAAVDADKLYRGYAEVWGKDSKQNDVAICWISRMVNVLEYNNVPAIELQLDLDWLALANAHGPLTLKNVVVQESSSYIPIAEASEIPVASSRLLGRYLRLNRQVTEITKEMRRGKLSRANFTSTNPKLVLLHGYCAGTNPWETHKSDVFTDSEFFLRADSNMNNEQFAQQVASFVDEKGVTSFGMVGHSQGGLVALHLLNYFETGMDYADGHRLIQSVGSPYLGCSAAGTAADLGDLFGVGCGANTDLSTDGAKLWLAGISLEARKEVFYYSTTYKQGNFFGDYCNMAINAILQWPNDGTAEYKYTQLPDGNNMGNTEKQCHTTDMKYMAQYNDKERNKVINSYAAR